MRSRIVVLLVSNAAIQNIKSEHTRQDNVLLEYEYALQRWVLISCGAKAQKRKFQNKFDVQILASFFMREVSLLQHTGASVSGCIGHCAERKNLFQTQRKRQNWGGSDQTLPPPQFCATFETKKFSRRSANP